MNMTSTFMQESDEELKIKKEKKLILHAFLKAQSVMFFCISGGFGVDFSSDPDKLEEGLKTVAKGLLQHGVTSYCPTIVTSPQESYSEVNKYATSNPCCLAIMPLLLLPPGSDELG